MKDLRNKLVFVTGAGSGIGYEICLAFAREGCRIIATAINEVGLPKLTSEIEALGCTAFTYKLDVSNESEFVVVANKVIEEHGCPDILVNNAGVAMLARILETTSEMWNKTCQVNVMGVVNGTKAFLDPMKSKPTPSFIINISSIASKTPFPFMSAYVASKYAVEGFTDAVRTELMLEDTQVNAVSIHPGLINTNLLPEEHLTFSPQQIANLRAKYENDGSPPSVVAKDVVKAVKQNKATIMTGAKARSGYWANKLIPKKLLAKLTAIDVIKAGLVD